jgi:glycyl-tRNA synthetase
LNTSLHTTSNDSGNVGKRYYRQDEIGTPFCVTVDYESLERQDVTVRDRDSKEQVRVSIDSLATYLRDALDA